MRVHELGSPSDENPKTQQDVQDKMNEIRKHETLRGALKDLINFYSLENASGTKDIILADYLLGCLAAFDKAVDARKMLPKECS